jgi:hypothetical protein
MVYISYQKQLLVYILEGLVRENAGIFFNFEYFMTIW